MEPCIVPSGTERSTTHRLHLHCKLVVYQSGGFSREVGGGRSVEIGSARQVRSSVPGRRDMPEMCVHGLEKKEEEEIKSQRVCDEILW